jgi:hypothetical protein
VKYIEQKIPSVDATLLCVSYAEAKFGRLFFKPITVPARIWLSLKGAKLWRQMTSSCKENTSHTKGTSNDIAKRSAMTSTFIGAKCNNIFRREFHHVAVSSYKKHQWHSSKL